jgi:WbqC-like protein family
MKIAIMQPYFLPYIGYFQLINAVDTFIFCDDVHFIKGGFINRNTILMNGQKYRFTIPVQHVHFDTTIRETKVANDPANWYRKLSKTLQNYQKAPYFDAVFPIFDDILRGSVDCSISDVAMESVETVLKYIDLQKKTTTTVRYNNAHLSGAERIVDICRQENATTYLNAIGGQKLFSKDYFSAHTIKLQFLKPNLMTYTQNSPPFIAGLSILDVLMWNDPATVKAMLSDYTLI